MHGEKETLQPNKLLQFPIKLIIYNRTGGMEHERI